MAKFKAGITFWQTIILGIHSSVLGGVDWYGPRHPGPPAEVRYLDPKSIPKTPNLRMHLMDVYKVGSYVPVRSRGPFFSTHRGYL